MSEPLKWYQCQTCKHYFYGRGANIPLRWENHGWTGQEWCPGPLVKTKVPHEKKEKK